MQGFFLMFVQQFLYNFLFKICLKIFKNSPKYSVGYFFQVFLQKIPFIWKYCSEVSIFRLKFLQKFFFNHAYITVDFPLHFCAENSLGIFSKMSLDISSPEIPSEILPEIPVEMPLDINSQKSQWFR